MTITGAGAGVPINYRNPLCFMRNVTLAGLSASANPLTLFAATAFTKNVLLLGVTSDSAADVVMHAYTVIGGSFGRVQYEEMASTSYPAQSGCILANNRFMNIRDPNRRGVGCTRTLPRGFAAVQNVWESARSGTSGALWEIGADGRTVAFDNIVFMHNSLPAAHGTGRFNLGYTAVEGAAGAVKEVHCRNNLWAGH